MQPSEAYWTTVATVIPVLILALTVEGHAAMARIPGPDLRPLRLSGSVSYVFVLITLMFGEIEALKVLAGKPKADWATSLIDAGITSGFGLLVGAAVVLLLAEAGWLDVAAQSARSGVRFLRSVPPRVRRRRPQGETVGAADRPNGPPPT